jgi:hypothetical protein
LDYKVVSSADLHRAIRNGAEFDLCVYRRTGCGGLVDRTVCQPGATKDAGADSFVGFGPTQLGPALMVYLDPLNRRTFLTEWEKAMEQR